MTFDDKKNLILSCLMIVFLISVSLWQMKKTEKIGAPSSWIEAPEPTERLSMPTMDSLTEIAEQELGFNLSETKKEEGIEEISFKEENIKDKIRFEYPADWDKISPNLVEQFMDIKYTDINILFFAHSKSILQPISFVILEIDLEEKENVLQKMEEIYQAENIEMEIKNIREKNQQEYLLEVSYTDKDNKIVFSKEKMIFLEDKTYLFSIFGFEREWHNFSQQINYLINSIQIIEQI